MMTLDVLYFAWVRERIGLPKERVTTGAMTVAGLVAELRAREDRYDLAFSDVASLRVAVDPLPSSSVTVTGWPSTGGWLVTKVRAASLASGVAIALACAFGASVLAAPPWPQAARPRARPETAIRARMRVVSGVVCMLECLLQLAIAMGFDKLL